MGKNNTKKDTIKLQNETMTKAHNNNRLLACLTLVWALFCLWYTNLKGPLTSTEIDHYMTILKERGDPELTDPAIFSKLRHFLEQDKGRQLFMVNAIDLNPDGGAENMQKYARYVIPSMMTRASHLILVGLAVSSALSMMGIDDDSMRQWTSVGIVRYRSRRDVIDMVCEPEFSKHHNFKGEALIKTIAYPVEAQLVIDVRVLLGLLVLAIPTVVQLVASITGRREKEHKD